MSETEQASLKINRLSDYPATLPEAIPQITKLIFLPEEQTPSDVIFVFGAKPRPELLQKVADVAHAALSPCIILTGGTLHADDTGVDMPESRFVHRHLMNLQHGFASIHVDDFSRHTIENITEAVKTFDFKQAKTVSVIGMHYALQRQLQTLKSYLPEQGITYYALPYVQTVDGLPVNAALWHTRHDTRQLVWGEVLRLELYEHRGFIRLDKAVKNQLSDIFQRMKFTPG